MTTNRDELDMKPNPRPVAEIDRRIAELCQEREGVRRELEDGKRKLKAFVDGLQEGMAELDQDLQRLLQERGQAELGLKVDD